MTQFRETGLGARGWHTHACMHAKSLELRPTLCDPMDCSLPGSSVYAILQARILEWVVGVVVVQLLSSVWLFAAPLTAACQASLSFTISQSLLKLMFIELVLPSNHLSVILFSCLQYFPASRSFLMNWLFASDSQSIGASASASTLPMNIQDWFPLSLTGLISLQSKGLSRVFSNTAVKKHQFFGTQLSLWFNFHMHTWLLEKP